MKKIMFLIYSLGAGGAERVLVDTVNYLDKDKYEITVQTLFHEETWMNLLDSSVNYKTVFRINSKYLKRLISGIVQYVIPPSVVYRLFFKGDYDVEVAFMEAFPTKVLAYSSNRNAAKYAWIHTDMEIYKKQDRLYRSLKHQKKCYERFQHIFCVSEGVKKAFIRKFNFSGRVDVVYNILNEKNILEKSKAVCPDIPSDKFKIVSIGRLCQEKGFERLIRISARLRDEGYSFCTMIVGDGILREELQALIQREKAEDCVKMMGFQENPYPYLAAADLYVSSSYREGFSTVVSEAVILGVPVITTNSFGMKEILGESEYGVITDNDEQALYEGIKRLLTDYAYYRHYCEKVKERSPFFSIQKRLEEYEHYLG